MEKSKLSEWWNINGNYKILHKINPLRLQFILNNFDKSIKKKHVLDIGCGGGLISESLAKINAQVTGIDENIYNIITIENQTWFTSGLKTTKYRDSSALQHITSNDFTVWNQYLDDGAYCSYNGISSNSDVYGYLYNWFAIEMREEYALKDGMYLQSKSFKC